jgi:hypothetical protein
MAVNRLTPEKQRASWGTFSSGPCKLVLSHRSESPGVAVPLCNVYLSLFLGSLSSNILPS